VSSAGKFIVIRDFEANFVLADDDNGPLSRIYIPTKHDGKSYRRLMEHDHGAAIFGAWILLVQVAAKCLLRGVLADADGPLTVEDLSVKTGCPAPVFREAIEVLASRAVGWIEIRPMDSISVGGVGGGLSVGRSVCTTYRPTDLQTSTAREATRNGNGLRCVRLVDPKHFTKTEMMVSLAKTIAKERPGHLPEGDEGILLVIGASEQAQTGKHPVRLFRWLLDTKSWDRIDPPQRTAAKRRLREFRGSVQ
jgi:hypothetical protein